MYIKAHIVKWLAKKLPDSCPFARLGIQPCKLNPWYEDVMAEKLKALGYSYGDIKQK
jgi:hypothetical protein